MLVVSLQDRITPFNFTDSPICPAFIFGHHTDHVLTSVHVLFVFEIFTQSRFLNQYSSPETKGYYLLHDVCLTIFSFKIIIVFPYNNLIYSSRLQSTLWRYAK